MSSVLCVFVFLTNYHHVWRWLDMGVVVHSVISWEHFPTEKSDIFISKGMSWERNIPFLLVLPARIKLDTYCLCVPSTCHHDSIKLSSVDRRRFKKRWLAPLLLVSQCGCVTKPSTADDQLLFLSPDLHIEDISQICTDTARLWLGFFLVCFFVLFFTSILCYESAELTHNSAGVDAAELSYKFTRTRE